MADLPPYNTQAECPKCGNDTISVTYHSDSVPAMLGGPDGGPCSRPYGSPLPGIGEHLCRRCGLCGYTWCEATLDSNAPGPA